MISKIKTVELYGNYRLFPLTDATICEFSGKSFLLSTELPDPNGRKLSIREFDYSTMTSGELVREIIFDKETARNAGACLKVDNGFVRRMQDCSSCYGGGVIFQYFDPLSIAQTESKVVTSLYPNTYRYNQGLHTFNQLDNIAVIDSRGYRSPFWGRIIHRIMENKQ